MLFACAKRFENHWFIVFPVLTLYAASETMAKKWLINQMSNIIFIFITLKQIQTYILTNSMESGLGRL